MSWMLISIELIISLFLFAIVYYYSLASISINASSKSYTLLFFLTVE